MFIDENTGRDDAVQTELLAQSILTEEERQEMIKANRAEAARNARMIKRERKLMDDRALREGRDPPSLIERYKKYHLLEMAADGIIWRITYVILILHYHYLPC